MKKNRFTEFFKGKGYYVLLFVGVIAIAAVAFLGSQMTSNQNSEDENYVDLNETDENIAANEEDNQLAENNPVSEGIANNGSNSTNDTVANDTTTDETPQVVESNGNQIEYEGYADTVKDDTEVAQETQSNETAKAEAPESVEANSKTVQADNTKAMENLSFKADEGLLWPVNGNVIMNYSMDHTIYFATLMQYKCNPAIIIDAEVGTEVKAAATGIVSSIDTDNEETGLTVTVNIGDGYSVVYGQLDNVSLEVGDMVNEGDIIGTVSEPTKYYTLEGSNLYFQVLENEQTVNPMLLLR